MKKVVCRVLAAWMAALMVVSSSACGEPADATTGPDTTTTIAAVTTTESQTANSTNVEDTTIGETTTSDTVDSTTTTESTTTDGGTASSNATTVLGGTTAATTSTVNKTDATSVATTLTKSTVASTTANRWWEGVLGIGGDKPQEEPSTTITTTTTKRTYPKRTSPTTTATTKRVMTTTTTRLYTGTRPTVARDDAYANDHGIYHILKGYCFDKVYRTAEWMPVVGYMKDGEVLDTLYDATTIMPSPSHVYWGWFNHKWLWDDWVAHTLKNLETLNRAARNVQEALELKEYKIRVFPTLVNPINAADNPHYYDDWGSLDGVKMDVNNDEHRFVMLKYLIDKYIREIAAQQFTNIELVGFYWFDEFVSEEQLEWYNRVTDYVRSKGLITMISTFYKAPGWTLCDEAGFDLHSMQPNYYPTGTVGSMNIGTERRLGATMNLINNRRIGGIETELGYHTEKDSITGLKMTLKLGVETGIVNGYHVHYFGGGPSSPYEMSRSTDAYFRSCYDELYKYMHNKLQPRDVWLLPIENEQKWLPDAIDWV